MTDLEIRFLPIAEIASELDRQVEILDHLAFSGEVHDDPEFNSIEWSVHDWLALGFMDNDLVTQFSLLKREILVGGQPLWVAGVGGVATHPDWQRRGLASQLLRAAPPFMRDEINVPFGLLICANQTQPVYARCGWQTVANSLVFHQDEQRRRLATCVMILPLTGQLWPAGEIDLCGLPW